MGLNKIDEKSPLKLISTNNIRNIQNNLSPNTKDKPNDSSSGAAKKGANENKGIEPKSGRHPLKDIDVSISNEGIMIESCAKSPRYTSGRPMRRAAPTDLREPLLNLKMRRRF